MANSGTDSATWGSAEAGIDSVADVNGSSCVKNWFLKLADSFTLIQIPIQPYCTPRKYRPQSSSEKSNLRWLKNQR